MKIRGLCNRGEFLGKLRKYEGVMADCAQLVGEMQIIYFAEIFSPGNLPAHPVYILLEIYPHILYIFCWKFTRTPVYILYIFCWKFTRTPCIYSVYILLEIYPHTLYIFCWKFTRTPVFILYIFCWKFTRTPCIYLLCTVQVYSCFTTSESLKFLFSGYYVSPNRDR